MSVGSNGKNRRIKPMVRVNEMMRSIAKSFLKSVKLDKPVIKL